MPPESPWLNRSHAARYIGVTPATLASYAWRDNEAAKTGGKPTGPPFWKPMFAHSNGSTRYHRDALDLWMRGDPNALRGLQNVHVQQVVRAKTFTLEGEKYVLTGEDLMIREYGGSPRRQPAIIERADWKRAAADVEAQLARLRP